METPNTFLRLLSYLPKMPRKEEDERVKPLYWPGTDSGHTDLKFTQSHTTVSERTQDFVIQSMVPRGTHQHSLDGLCLPQRPQGRFSTLEYRNHLVQAPLGWCPDWFQTILTALECHGAPLSPPYALTSIFVLGHTFAHYPFDADSPFGFFPNSFFSVSPCSILGWYFKVSFL